MSKRGELYRQALEENSRLREERDRLRKEMWEWSEHDKEQFRRLRARDRILTEIEKVVEEYRRVAGGWQFLVRTYDEARRRVEKVCT